MKKLIGTLALSLCLAFGGASANALPPGGGGGIGFSNCFSCHVRGWGPTSWSECVSSPNGSGGDCQTTPRDGCTFSGGCTSEPDDLRFGLSL